MMVPWYSLLLVYTAFDIIIQLSVFMGRYDARTMQPAVHGTWGGKRMKKSKKKKNKKKKKKKKKKGPKGGPDTGSSGSESDSSSSSTSDLDLAGCVFDESSSSPELWFDFMADCGDGFNSSYQVARVLADPNLTVLTHDRGDRKTLPRGEFLVIGGDLAYPDPSPDTFEKRFFRTFEDALPPPPCYRKEAISTKKPNLANTGWANIFKEPVEDPNDPDEVLEKVRVHEKGGHHHFGTLQLLTSLLFSFSSRPFISTRAPRLTSSQGTTTGSTASPPTPASSSPATGSAAGSSPTSAPTSPSPSPTAGTCSAWTSP